jgi:hypothetical protein
MRAARLATTERRGPRAGLFGGGEWKSEGRVRAAGERRYSSPGVRETASGARSSGYEAGLRKFIIFLSINN